MFRPTILQGPVSGNGKGDDSGNGASSAPFRPSTLGTSTSGETPAPGQKPVGALWQEPEKAAPAQFRPSRPVLEDRQAPSEPEASRSSVRPVAMRPVPTEQGQHLTYRKPAAAPVDGRLLSWRVDTNLADDILFSSAPELGTGDRRDVRGIVATLNFKDVSTVLSFGHVLDGAMLDLSAELMKLATENGETLDRMMGGIRDAVNSVDLNDLLQSGAWSMFVQAITGVTAQGEIKRAMETVDALLPGMAAQVDSLQSSLVRLEGAQTKAIALLDTCRLHAIAGRIALGRLDVLKSALEQDDEARLKLREAKLAEDTLTRRVEAFVRMASDIRVALAQADLQKSVVVQKVTLARSALLELVSGWKSLCGTILTKLASNEGHDLGSLALDMAKTREKIAGAVQGAR